MFSNYTAHPGFASGGDSYFPKSGAFTFPISVGFYFSEICGSKVTVYTDDFASMEALLPGEWKKSHPDSRSMVHHMTEAEHVEAILKSRAKRKAAEQEASKEEPK